MVFSSELAKLSMSGGSVKGDDSGESIDEEADANAGGMGERSAVCGMAAGRSNAVTVELIGLLNGDCVPTVLNEPTRQASGVVVMCWIAGPSIETMFFSSNFKAS